MSFKSVLHHPYLVYEDVQLIFNAKRKFGKINYSILESQKILPLFKLKKIKPYFKYFLFHVCSLFICAKNYEGSEYSDCQEPLNTKLKSSHQENNKFWAKFFQWFT